MADYEIHADYDRNGRLDASPAEYALRNVAPGAILVPNLDSDSRRLPTRVTADSRVTLDRDQPVVLANDDEALPLRIIVNNARATAGSRFFLRPVGFARIRVRINDTSGHILPWDTSRPTDIPITLPSGTGILNLTITTRTLPGSPIGRTTDLNPRFTLNPEDESALHLQLISVDPSGTETVRDTVRFTIAPFVILDNASTAIRVYICDKPVNQPSVIEIRNALRLIRVPLVIVPPDVSGNDSWLQDQFQHALIQGSDGWRQVLLHLPRLRSDTSNGSSAGNLSTFVMSHFPSRNIGVFEDLWARELQFQDSSGRSRRLSFRECDQLAIVMALPIRLVNLLIDAIKRIDPSYDPEWPHTGEGGKTTWSDIRGWLPRLVRELRTRADRARHEGSAEWRSMVTGFAVDAQARFNQVASRLPFNPDRGLVGLPTSNGQIEVTSREAHRIYQRILQMHSSSNFGGNIEASPPMPDARLGKIVIGNSVVDGEYDFMDPDLLQLLYKQCKQPIIQLDSTWLDVGHIDEFMAFTPDRRGSGASFAIFFASSGLALKLIQEAERQYIRSVPVDYRRRRMPSGIMPRLTTDGSAPVTRLFRGKVWEHDHKRPTGEQIPDIREPPRIYQDVAQAMNGGDPADPYPAGINIYGINYWPGEGPDRTYPADITVRELLYGEEDLEGQSTNAFIEEQFLTDAAQRLRAAFPQSRMFPMPVLFDRIASTREWGIAESAFSTGAFTPNVINLQVINGNLLIPRPYGPRMRLNDGIAVIAAATAEMNLPDSLVRRIDERFVRRHRLRTGVYWIHRQAPVYRTLPLGTIRRIYKGLENERDVIAQFSDSFPGATPDQLRQKIIDPNRRHFDGNGSLRDGWRRFEIAETMVDIFETYIQAVAAELDVPVFWIDSWFYHLHEGGIHCGTNVLRIPSRANPLPNVWSVPNIVYEGQSQEIEEETITVPRS